MAIQRKELLQKRMEMIAQLLNNRTKGGNNGGSEKDESARRS
jgi:hypothetical protein